MEVYVDDESKLTLHGLQQHYVKLKDNEKNRKLFELLDVLEFNQVDHSQDCTAQTNVLKVVSLGRHLRQVHPTLHGLVHTSGRTELPSHCHPPQHDTRRSPFSLPTV